MTKRRTCTSRCSSTTMTAMTVSRKSPTSAAATMTLSASVASSDVSRRYNVAARSRTNSVVAVSVASNSSVVVNVSSSSSVVATVAATTA